MDLTISNTTIPTFWMVIAILWTLPWKGVALWKAVKNSDKAWFILLLIINTLGILEILYIFVFSKREYPIKPVEEKSKLKEK